MTLSFVLKVLVSALVIAAVSEVGKKWSAFAAMLAALPLTSILAMLWLYRDTRDTGKIVSLSYGIFWAVLPSLFFFLLLPFLMKKGLGFGAAMGLSCAAMVALYSLYALTLKWLGISL